MPLIAWSDQRFALGITSMDATHREFIALLNALDEATGTDFIRRFTELFDHTQVHFERENDLMEQSGFPAITEHREEHRRVLNEMTQFKQRVDKGLIGFGRVYVRERLPAWFGLHGATMDSALAAHVNNAQRVGRPSGRHV